MAAISLSSRNPPEEFICSLSHEIMKEPVITKCSHTFEESKIKKWLEDSSSCPLCRSRIQRTDLILNRALMGCIQSFISSKEDIKIPFSAEVIGWGKSLSYGVSAFSTPYAIKTFFDFAHNYKGFVLPIAATVFFSGFVFLDNNDRYRYKMEKKVTHGLKTLTKLSKYILKYNKKELVVTLALAGGIASHWNCYNVALSVLFAGASYISGQIKNKEQG
ncbi:MAG: hypothetical protein K940chlam5_01573 [Candidatus Anoxychlamydiales bacterium]|nr:hypothetical protein [Candidatus Anoxychlamydiales bacterium]